MTKAAVREGIQLSMFQLDDPVLMAVARRDIRARYQQPHTSRGTDETERDKKDCFGEILELRIEN